MVHRYCRRVILFAQVISLIIELGVGWKHGNAFHSIRLSMSRRSPPDAEVFDIVEKEYQRQIAGIELIASENFVSPSVQLALGSCLTNKYSEGLPFARYYGGNQYVDELEILCQHRALKLFGLDNNWAVNVQPYSGSIANLAALLAVLQPHDRIMGLDLRSGGHLSHGYMTQKRKVSASSMFYESMPYFVDSNTGLIDYDGLEQAALAFRPKLIIAGASAYPRDWDYRRMRLIADSCGALLLADISHIAGLVATHRCHSPFDYSHIVTTTTHKTLRGPRSALIFCHSELKDKIDRAVFPALQGGPHNNQIAAVAVALQEAMLPSFKEYIDQVLLNTATMANTLMDLGYDLATNGTDNHLFLWDLRRTRLTGSQMELLLEACGISVNKNMIPSDRSALYPNGLRIGTPAMTSRGMGTEGARKIATFLHEVVQLGREASAKESSMERMKAQELLAHVESRHQRVMEDIRQRVRALAMTLPIPSLGIPTCV